MAPVVKRAAEDPGSQPKKSKQLKLDAMITVSPLTKKVEKKGSVVTNLSDSQEILTFSSGSRKDSQTEAQKPRVTRSVSRTVSLTRSSTPPALARTSTPKTPALVRTSTQRSSGSGRSLSQLFSQSSLELSFSQDLGSQDSFISETSSDPTNTHFDITKISQDPKKQKQYLVHHLVAQRRLHDLGLEVGPGGFLVLSRGVEVAAEPLSRQNCLDIWFCLDTDEELKELGRQVDQGWLEASSLLKKFIKADTFPPAAAMHKFLMEGVIRHPQSLVRGQVFSALCYCLQTHPPGNSQSAPHCTRLYSTVVQVLTTGECLRSTWR